jgi:hypothetical protein
MFLTTRVRLRIVCRKSIGPVTRLLIGTLYLTLAAIALSPSQIAAQEIAAQEKGSPTAKAAEGASKFEIEGNWTRLSEEHEVWIDTKKKQVMVGGQVCLRAGQLEMFACPQNTKEHESVVSVNTPARVVHAGLLAVGAKEGKAVQYDPTYKPATGMEVAVEVVWKDREGKQQRASAQNWVKHLKTGKALAYPWVFVGSAFWEDKSDGQRHYIADSGEFICVSNFQTAMLDLPIASSQANDQLLFTAFTDHIPPLATPVRLILTPKARSEKTPSTSSTKSSEKAASKKTSEKKID